MVNVILIIIINSMDCDILPIAME